jgi:hypothetical protein
MKAIHPFKFTFMLKNSLVIVAIAVLMLGVSGCKNKKKITDNPNPKDNVVKVDEQVIKAKSTLQALIDNEDSKTIEEKEKIIADIKALNLNNPEVDQMIKQVETSIKKEKEVKQKAIEDAKPENVLRKSFDGIAHASSPEEASSLIQQALQMFSSDKANVLIIVHKGATDADTDYDEPTNIGKYLNYLKDQKKNLNDVEKINYDANNKIKTLILIKK